MKFWLCVLCLLVCCALSADEESSDDEGSGSEESAKWLAVLYFSDLNLSHAAYGVSWGDSLDEVRHKIRDGYALQNAAKFFVGPGGSFFPDWRISFESGRKIEKPGGWRKGLREFYLFSTKSFSECLVLQFYKGKLAKIYHQFPDETKITLEPSILTYTDFAKEPGMKMTPVGVQQSLGDDYRFLPDLLRSGGLRDESSRGDGAESIAVNNFLLKSIYGITWESPPDVVDGSALTRAWVSAVSKDIPDASRFSSLKAATTAPSVEPNATERGSWTYYFLKTHDSSRYRSNSRYLIIGFENDGLKRLDMITGDGHLLTVLPPAKRWDNLRHYSELWLSLLVMGFLIFLMVMVAWLKRRQRKKREYELIREARSNQGAASATRKAPSNR